MGADLTKVHRAAQDVEIFDEFYLQSREKSKKVTTTKCCNPSDINTIIKNNSILIIHFLLFFGFFCRHCIEFFNLCHIITLRMHTHST